MTAILSSPAVTLPTLNATNSTMSLTSPDPSAIDVQQHLQQQHTHLQAMIQQYEQQYQQLLQQMQDQHQQLKSQYQLKHDDLLQAQKQELQNLYTTRRHHELQVTDNQLTVQQQYSTELSALRWSDQQDFVNLQDELQSSIRLFEQQLSEMKSIYTLNSEKLQYNHIVLAERDIENRSTMESLRLKLRKLKELLNTVITRYQRSQQQWLDENKKLSHDYARTADLLKELQTKYIAAESVEQKQWLDIWELNAEQCRSKLEKLEKGVQLINKQILHREGGDSQAASWSEHDSKQRDVLGSTMNGNVVTSGNGVNSTQNLNSQQCIAVIDLLLNNCSYLITADVAVADGDTPATDDLSHKMKSADTILTAFGVEDTDDLLKLVQYFLPYTSSEKDTTVSHTDIHSAIQTYLATLAPQASSSNSNSTVISQHTATKRQQQQQRERQYWLQLAAVHNDDAQRLWPVLEKSLHKYTTVLQERAELIENTSDLAQQNNELRQLLEQYDRIGF